MPRPMEPSARTSTFTGLAAGARWADAVASLASTRASISLPTRSTKASTTASRYWGSSSRCASAAARSSRAENCGSVTETSYSAPGREGHNPSWRIQGRIWPMRAIWITKAGGPDALEVRETADPEPGPGQVRIRVRAAGLCFADVMAAQGLYPDAPKPPCVVGYEAAGVVDALGDGSEGLRVGQRVLAVTHFGGHADVVCVPADQVTEIPDRAGFEEAAAIPIHYVTAYHLLFRVANVHPRERVLVHAAAGGVGTAVLQLCRAVDELVIFGTASAAKHDVLRAEGCTYPIDYRAVDYATEIRKLTGGEGVDVVLDPLGGKDWRKGLKLLRAGGRQVELGL